MDQNNDTKSEEVVSSEQSTEKQGRLIDVNIVEKMENFMKEAHKTPKMDIFKIPVLENDKKN